MEDKVLLLRGILWLLAIPIFLGVFAFLFLFLLPSFKVNLLPPIAVISIILYALGSLFALLFLARVHYSDSSIVEKVVIPKAPNKIEKLLKVRTRGTHHLINVEIISILGKRPLIQSRIVENVRQSGIVLSSTRIIEYLAGLEESGILHSVKEEYEREYSLTEKGKWCYEAIIKCFPKRQFWFVYRHYLGIRRLPPFPNTFEE